METVADPFAGLEDEVIETKAELVTFSPPEQTPEQYRESMLRSIEDDIFQQSATVVRDTLKARDVDPDATESPEAWLLEEGLTPKEAKKRLRVALGAHQSLKDSPAYIQMAQKVFAGVVRARATEKAAPKVLNMNFVTMVGQAPETEYPVLVVETTQR